MTVLDAAHFGLSSNVLILYSKRMTEVVSHISAFSKWTVTKIFQNWRSGS